MPGRIGGAELASGFISLSVRYSSALNQIAKDFTSLEQQAASAGARAGKAHGEAVVTQARTAINSGFGGVANDISQGLAGGIKQGLSEVDVASDAAAFGQRVSSSVASGIQKVGGIRNAIAADVASIRSIDISSEAKRLGSQFTSGIESMGTSALNSFSSMARNIGTQFHSIGTSVGDFASQAALAADAVTTKFRSIDFSSAAKNIGTQFSSMISSLPSVAGRVATQLDTAFENTGIKMMSGLSTGLSRGMPVLLTGMSNVSHGIESVARGAGSAFERVAGGIINKAKSVASAIGSAVTGPIAQMIGLTAVVGGIGYAFDAGFKKNEALEAAKIKLEALGRSASQVNEIIQTTKDVIAEGGGTTSFADAITAATTAVSSGIPQSGLKEWMTTIQNVAALTGNTVDGTAQKMLQMKEMFNSSTRDWRSLATDYPELVEMVREVTGKTDAELSDMAKKGTLNIDTIMSAASSKTAGMAKAMSRTIEGEFAQLKNNIAGITGALLAPFFDSISPGFQGLNDKLKQFADYLSTHQAAIVGFFKDLGDWALHTSAAFVDAFAQMSFSVGGLLKDLSHIPGLGKLDSIGDQVQNFARGAEHAANAIERQSNSFDTYMDDLQKTATLLDNLKGATAELNDDNVTLKITDPTPEIEDNLKKLGFDIQHMPDGSLTIKPTNKETQDILDAARDKKGLPPLPPVTMPVSADLSHIPGQIDYFMAKMPTPTMKILAQIDTGTGDSTTPGASGQPTLGGVPFTGSGSGDSTIPDKFNNIPDKNTDTHGKPMGGSGPNSGGRASDWANPKNWFLDGGIQSFAWGGRRLPRSAMIQSPVGPAGLVNWAEPGTGGEAFIPLHPAKRHKSLEVWKQTGNILLGGMKFGAHGGGKLWKFLSGGISGADPRPTQSGLLQVIWSNAATGQKVGEAGGSLVGPGTDQPGYYRSDWGGHTGHVHTAFATSPGGEFYGLRKGTDIRQGSSGFPSWVYKLGNEFGVVPSTYAGHQEASGYNRGIDWWPKGKSDMSGQSYTPQERQKLQTFAQALAGAASSGRWGSFGGYGGSGGDQYTAGGVRYTAGSAGGSGRGVRFGRHGTSSAADDYNAPDSIDSGVGQDTSSGVGDGTVSGSGDTSALSGSSAPTLSSFLSSQQYAGGATPFKDSGPSDAQQAAEDKRERDLQDRIDKINDKLKEYDEKKSEWTDKTKQSTKDTLEDEVKSKKKELADVTADLSQAQQNWQDKLTATQQRDQYKDTYSLMYPDSGGTRRRGGQSAYGPGQYGDNSDASGGPQQSFSDYMTQASMQNFDLQGLGDIMSSGLAEEFLPPGFANPFASDLFRVPSTLLSFIGGVIGGPTGQALNLAGAVMSGKGSNIAQAIGSFIPAPFGTANPARPGQEALAGAPLPQVGSNAAAWQPGGNFGPPTGPAPGPLDANGKPSANQTFVLGPTYGANANVNAGDGSAVHASSLRQLSSDPNRMVLQTQ